MTSRVVISLPPAFGGDRSVRETEPHALVWTVAGVTYWQTGGSSGVSAEPLTVVKAALQDAGPGSRAVGYLSYEYGHALDPVLSVPAGERLLPDAWWAVLRKRGDRAPRTGNRIPPNQRDADTAKSSEVASSLSDDKFKRAVTSLRAEIGAGEFYQVNLTRRWQAPLDCLPTVLFARLAGTQPPRFSIYIEDRAQGWAVLCLSPELLLRRRGETVETWPIKGTRPRPPTAALLRAARRELAGCEKDRAELAMIVDLERNDLNRVCRPGSVEVTHWQGTLTTRDVVHLEARVSGRLEPGIGLVDLMRAVFPGGSVTGAPKIAACRAIATLEPAPRSIYCGALGVIEADGDLTLALPIRTGYTLGSTLYFHSGCGIVWDSDPQAEELESRAKVRSWLSALSSPGVGGIRGGQDP